MIKINALTKIYKKEDQVIKALDGVDLHIEKGDIYGIIGLSGAGKSSLVRCINRIEDPTSGEIFISGTNILKLHGKSLREARQGIGMIFQNFNLLSSKTVYENIAFPLKLQKLSNDEIHQRVTTLLEKVELTDKTNAYPVSLSGGQKQRVGIARALANSPAILLCDEATSALDPKTTKQILALLKAISLEFGITLVVITHEMEVIKAICNKVAILEAGKVLVQGDTTELFTSKTEEKTRHFFGEVEAPACIPVKGTRLLLTFAKDSAKFPILSKLIRQFGIDINILSGHIESIQDEVVGKLMIELLPQSGLEDQVLSLSELLATLSANNVLTEVIQ